MGLLWPCFSLAYLICAVNPVKPVTSSVLGSASPPSICLPPFYSSIIPSPNLWQIASLLGSWSVGLCEFSSTSLQDYPSFQATTVVVALIAWFGFALTGKYAKTEIAQIKPKDAEAPPIKEVDTAHYGTKPGHFETLIIYCPTSEGVSEVSERANE